MSRIVAESTNALPRLCFVGPMLGRNPGWVTTPGEIMNDLFAGLGYSTLAVSSIPNRYLRAADIVRTIWRERTRADVVILQVYGGPSFVIEDAASLAARRFALPTVMMLHGGAMPEFMARHPSWARRVLARACDIVVPSAYLARAIARHGLSARVIPNLLQMADYPFRVRRRPEARLFWMRTFHPIYNPLMAIRAFARIRRRVPSATLVMAGQEKGLGEEIRRRASTLGLADSVRFPGFLDRESKAREGDAADLFLNTNRIDNMPVSVVEACAMGLPVVATAVGGVPDLLAHEETGLLVPDDDDDAMAESILRLLGDSDLAERLSVGGRRLAEECSWDRIRPQWESLFASAALNRRGMGA